jgi:nucleotide-binding universal stress UspA family protein
MDSQICPLAKLDNLLAPTDGSKFSDSALKEAINLAKKCKSKLIALWVVQTNIELEAGTPWVIDKAEKEAREHLESIKNQATKEGVDCETIVSLSEEPYQAIVDHASLNKVDMIIMGTHSRKGMKRLMMGSVTAKVIGHAPCNILVLPLNAKFECKNILIATDGSQYSQAAASEAIGIAKRCEISLFVISVASSDEEMISAQDAVKKVVETAEKDGIRIESIITKGKPYEAIIEAAKQNKGDLIVMGSHGKTGLKRLLMGSVTERVIGHSESAVLVVKI